MTSDMRDLIRLVEMPLSVSLVGGTEPGAFRSDDITLATNPKAQEKMGRLWATSLADVHLYMLNRRTKEDGERSELLFKSLHHAGPVAPEELDRIEKELGVRIRPKKGAITILLTQNEGRDRVPLTGWVVAHRMFHIFEQGGRNVEWGRPRYPTLNKGHNLTYAAVDRLLSTAHRAYEGQAVGSPLFDFTLACRIGTTKAARDEKLSDAGELKPEAFAQYLLTGQIRLNPAPEVLDMNVNGRQFVARIKDENAMATMQAEVDRMKADFLKAFEKLIRHAKGKIFVL